MMQPDDHGRAQPTLTDCQLGTLSLCWFQRLHSEPPFFELVARKPLARGALFRTDFFHLLDSHGRTARFQPHNISCRYATFLRHGMLHLESGPCPTFVGSVRRGEPGLIEVGQHPADGRAGRGADKCAAWASCSPAQRAADQGRRRDRPDLVRRAARLRRRSVHATHPGAPRLEKLKGRVNHPVTEALCGSSYGRLPYMALPVNKGRTVHNP